MGSERARDSRDRIGDREARANRFDWTHRPLSDARRRSRFPRATNIRNRTDRGWKPRWYRSKSEDRLVDGQDNPVLPRGGVGVKWRRGPKNRCRCCRRAPGIVRGSPRVVAAVGAVERDGRPPTPSYGPPRRPSEDDSRRGVNRSGIEKLAPSDGKRTSAANTRPGWTGVQVRRPSWNRAGEGGASGKPWTV